MRFDPPGGGWDHLLVPGSGLTSPRALLSQVPRAEEKPVFRLDGVDEVLDALAAAGAAVVSGQLVAVADGAAVPIPDPADEPDPGGEKKFEALLDMGPSRWRCVRAEGEAWDAFVLRTTDAARQALARLGMGAAERAGGGEVFVDLAWVTEDEPRLFDLPAYLRGAYDRLGDTGRFNDLTVPLWEGLRVRWAGAADGSFYGAPADRVAAVPRDARYANVNGRARDLARLAELERLEHLEVWRSDDRALEVVGSLPGLRVLELPETRATNLDALAGLPALEVLSVGGNRLRDVSGLAKVASLRALWISVASLGHLDWAAPLTQLRSLFFTGGLTTLPTLAPLSGLGDLRHLVVGHVRIKDKSLRPLHALKALRTLEVPERFPLEEMAALAAALPNVQGIPRQAFVASEPGKVTAWCNVCGSTDVLQTIGMPVRVLCRACDDAKIRKYALKWEMVLSQEQARARGGSV